MTDFNLTFVGARGYSDADIARQAGLVATTASDIEAVFAIKNRTIGAVAASTANVNILSAPASLDGVTLASGDRVLLWTQSAAAENGVWVFNGAGSALTRWTGADAWHELPGLVIGVQSGSTYANTAWQVFSPHGGTLGTTSVDIKRLAGSYTALLGIASTWLAQQGFSSGLTFGSGSAVGPGCAVFGDTNTGFFAPGADTLAVTTGGVERARWLSNGKVGIGITAPITHLHVKALDTTGPVVGSDQVVIAGGSLHYSMYAAGVLRMGIGLAGAETGSNAGSDLRIFAYTDAGGFRGACLTISRAAGHITPGADNTQNMGSASLRFNTYYGGTGTINTSDAREKTLLEAPPQAFFDAILSVPLVQFQWNDAIAAKGAENARIHYGPTAQAVRDALIAAGFDPSRYALFCEDEISAPVTKMVEVQRQKVRTIATSESVVEIIDGQAVQRTIEREIEEPLFEEMPLFDEAGEPVMNGEAQAVWRRPVMETVEVEERVMEPTGETRLGLRLDQFDRYRTEAVNRKAQAALDALAALQAP
ncbi:tail fiber domain-containing protein [Brevundimonas sp. 2R-24]|uniref:Tail fiber domain-containing protein n=1 Tax=Peiella sedimenti TaxID=3061083 RepID=A0ABT8SPC6_9CAUL|nr:tail fiber domain-containing protein [Caulobacteraceae bacterium XZ-24]